METVVLTPCQHLKPLCTPQGLQQVSRAAETVFAPANRPILNIGKQSVPQCLHPGCQHPVSRDLYICIHCVHIACLGSQSPVVHHPQSDPFKLDLPSSNASVNPHFKLHSSSSGHSIYLSAEHGHLFCVQCDDFVHNRFLDSAIEMQSHIAQAHRRNFTSSLSPLDPPLQQAFLQPPSFKRSRFKQRRLKTRTGFTASDKELALVAERGILLSSFGTSVRPPVGLFNLGNSCYMNSVLQAFLNAPPLRNFFLADEHKLHCSRPVKSDCFACAMDHLICDSCFATTPTVKNGAPTTIPPPFLVPQTVLDIVWRNAEHLASYTQHDAHEFLIAAINLLNTHCRTQQSPRKKQKTAPFLAEVNVNKALMENSKGEGQMQRKLSPVSPIANLRASPCGAFAGSDLLSPRSTSIVQNLFSGTLQSDVVCRVCGSSSPTLEKFYDISLDVDKFVKPASTRRSRAQSPAIDNGKDDANSVFSGARVSQTVSASVARIQLGSQEGERDASDRSNHSNSDLNKNAADAANDTSESERGKDLDSANTLQDCLSRFTEPELLGPSSKMHCSTCGTRQEAMKQLSIRTLPPIVCFHFKRFEQSFAGIRRNEMVKIDTPIEFPADGLDLSSFRTSEVLRRRNVMNTSSAGTTVETALLKAMSKELKEQNSNTTGDGSELRESREALYDLFAVVNHIGKIDSGHYTAMVRKQGMWFRCDDDKVSPLNDMDRVIRSEEAYLVFYVQRHPNVQY